ncbi:MAG TPA: penicillin-binding protein 2, partial [Clostridia bacterium]|nr:penicillin-binding protein 2 [Clostridia bacterium]
MLEKLKDRYFILSIFIIAFCGLLVSQLANLQVVNGNYYNILANKISQINKTVIAPRGGIFDRNNTPIAVNTTGYS